MTQPWLLHQLFILTKVSTINKDGSTWWRDLCLFLALNLSCDLWYRWLKHYLLHLKLGSTAYFFRLAWPRSTQHCTLVTRRWHHLLVTHHRLELTIPYHPLRVSWCWNTIWRSTTSRRITRGHWHIGQLEWWPTCTKYSGWLTLRRNKSIIVLLLHCWVAYWFNRIIHLLIYCFDLANRCRCEMEQWSTIGWLGFGMAGDSAIE